ncbi:TonB-dependent receptor [Novosphingobium sp. BL-52-GroH]|uniref:TonB-dependent receptor n=1 Tax=Novosphingobium sp. BL-52-GroH TaxID=3349877 RepID=UPI00384A7A3E
MLAAEPPIDVPSEVSEDINDVIEVIGARTAEALKIDRRTYQVRDTPHSAQKNVVQLLRGLPAVTVTPDGRVLVLGAGMTRIYVDGRPYLGDPTQYLRTVHGSDIERIEVITNASAQFSSEGAGGVINLVLRKTRGEGLTGNASLEESSYGYALVDTTLDYKHGDWTYQLKAGGNIGTILRRTYRRQRSILRSDSDAATVNSEVGLYAYDGTVGRVSGKATYKLDARTSISAQIGGGGGHDIISDRVDYLAVTPDFMPFSEHRRLSSVASFITGELNVDHSGAREGEALNATLQFYTNPGVRDVTNARFSDGRRYRIDLRKPATSIDAQIDWKHPVAVGQILSLGSAWHVDDTNQDYKFSSPDRSGSFGSDMEDSYDARSRTFSGYVSFQQTFGLLTLAPGLRGEANERQISSPGGDDVRIRRADIFPSFHASYQGSKQLQFAASFSKRIDRVPLEYLRPFATVEDTYNVFEGNPLLKDQSTNAYEISAQFRPGNVELGATIYLRETRRLWSKSYVVNAEGSNAYSYVNSGNRWNSGAQFDITFPILPEIKASASANLFSEHTPVELTDGQDMQRTFRYSTNGTLEWSGKDRGSVAGDVAQLQWSYNSRSREYQIRKASWFDLSASYTHSLDRTLSLSATFRYSGRESQRLIAPSVDEIFSRRRTPDVQIKLQKTL